MEIDNELKTAPLLPGGAVKLSAFFWNVHWECSAAARGATGNCKQRIGERFAELAKEADADVVASIELADSASQPAEISKYGLPGWKQVDGPCNVGQGGDTAALAFAPGWEVEKGGGGCLRTDYDTRAFAVARVKPPSPVRGCPRLCVVAIHAPHTSINAGKDIVQDVCGAAADACGVAMGDWNIPASGVAGLWRALIGGTPPSLAVPDQRTCCWPESDHYGIFDHIATSIDGAEHVSQTVHPYQLLEEKPMKQHRAVSALLHLPGVASLTSLKS